MLLAKNCLQNREIYYGNIIIPKLKINHGFFDVKDGKNNLENGIKLLYNKNNSMIFAGYSGSHNKGIFNNLVLLKENDEIIIKRKNLIDEYRISEISYAKKDGNIKISKKKNEKILILTTTCQNRKEYQLIIKAILLL